MMQTHIKFLEHLYNQAYKELDFETAEELYRIKEILIDLDENQVSVEPEVIPEIADIDKIIEYAFKLGEDWGVTYGGWFTPDRNKQKAKLKSAILATKEKFEL